VIDTRLRLLPDERAARHLVSDGKLPRKSGTVGHHDQNGLAGSVKLEEKIRHRVSGGAIEVPRRLVAQQQYRVPDQCPRQRGTLFLPS